MRLSFKNRIALHYMIATAVTMAVAFTVVYFVVQGTVYQNLDNDLSFEAEKHTDEIRIVGDSIKIKNKKEWEEREHLEVQINPVFIQILDKNGKFMDNSPNLKNHVLAYNPEQKFGGHFNETLNNRAIRQVQIPIEQNGKIKGFILAAMSLESSKMVLLNLRNVLIVSYLFLLAGLYFMSRYLAGRGIIPVKVITETTKRITQNSLNERVILPHNKDELYDLSFSINELLQRIENTIERKRQFTSDASHELRTPLSTLKGTLEVLIRKPRERSEYEDKIKCSLTEIDRMTATIEQLLLLARLDVNSRTVDRSLVPLPHIIDEILSRHKTPILQKKLTIAFQKGVLLEEMAPQYYTTLIMENIIGNAIKYAKEASTIHIEIARMDSKIICKIQDEGIGIKKEDLNNVFKRFFRSDALNHKNIPGNGLGLSIAKKAADAINAKIYVDSEFGVGTTFTISF
ncbi:HAMP domain-containing histidine kinase [Maribacter polysiphoniae]|uniref:histidine kinase n=1 Tax=Maribacter polysiphoniae TaxID=429344 RepID=A0A316E8Z4_9FLAO|nr:HAMP domain-containing sensor histidine kinase [Maribacter polysiphoniae]MBD1260376.1 HAMP domain-containing histidine kinase [Maribacter polysiphoniae]PWK25839.1 signal transduction histidine kinase [Maribacter polysiphoniae]